MNRIHRTVFNARLGTYIAAAETARARGKASGLSGALLSGVLLATPAFGQVAAGALPTGGQVTAGQASMATAGSTLTVTQGSQRAAINWQSFNVGSNATVQFNQPNASAVVLNRVVGNEGSVINGALRANGQVWLVNPNGVLFNAGARVDVGGLVASTRGISDADFMAGRSTLQGSGAGDVVNLGEIHAADGGYVTLIGRAVKNDGTVTARLGTVAGAAGDQVTLNFNGDSLVGVAIDQGTLNALVANGGAIRADGGQIVLTAKTASALLDAVVNTTGELRAQTIANRKGRIVLLSDMDHGRTEVAGTLDASAPITGDGGFIETSAADVRIHGGTVVTTASANGRAGTWLIDPTDFTISAGTGVQTSAGIGATTLESALAAGNVTIQTQSAGTDAGDINVDAAVSWSANQLTLEAHGDINVNAVMTASGTSTLDMKTGYNFDSSNPSYDPAHLVRMGYAANGDFAGAIRFTSSSRSSGYRAGTGILTINGQGYTLLDQLGAQGSTTAGDLAAVASNVTGFFALAGNIDAAASASWTIGGVQTGWRPIGMRTLSGCCYTYEDSGNFTGRFNGLGHTISGITTTNGGGYSDYYSTNGGFFSGLGGNAVVSNLALRNLAIGGYGAQATAVGGLAGTARNATVANVQVHGTVTNNGANFAGGFVGEIHGGTTISRSVSAVAVNGNSVGGFAGAVQFDNDPTVIRDSAFTGSVTSAQGGGVIGMIGNQMPIYIDNVLMLGSVTGSGQAGSVHGLVVTSNAPTLTNFYWTGQNVSAPTLHDSGTVLTAAQLSDIATYNQAGWSIVGNAQLSPTAPAVLGSGRAGQVWQIYVAPPASGGNGPGQPGGETLGEVATIDAGNAQRMVSSLATPQVGQIAPLRSALASPTLANAVAPRAVGATGFLPGEPLALLASVDGKEPDLNVTLTQARSLVRSAGAAPGAEAGAGTGGAIDEAGEDVRVPVGRNTLATIVNGGVRLPSGVDQMLFLVKP